VVLDPDHRRQAGHDRIDAGVLRHPLRVGQAVVDPQQGARVGLAARLGRPTGDGDGPLPDLQLEAVPADRPGDRARLHRTSGHKGTQTTKPSR
jgi:hypothetical protein